jgi:tRNA pseudouridine38-40 synthase
MVRNITALLVAVGRGKINHEDIPKILEARKRVDAMTTAPAHGLFLVNVGYNESDMILSDEVDAEV